MRKRSVVEQISSVSQDCSPEMHPENEHTLSVLSEREMIEAYERLAGPLPPARQCVVCESWFVVTPTGRRASRIVRYCSESCRGAATSEAKRRYEAKRLARLREERASQRPD